MGREEASLDALVLGGQERRGKPEADKRLVEKSSIRAQIDAAQIQECAHRDLVTKHAMDPGLTLGQCAGAASNR